MKSLFLTFILVFSFSAFAENMAGQDLEHAWLENADGSQTYVGLCSTHEHSKLTKRTKVIQKQIKSARLDERQIDNLVKKVDRQLWKLVAVDSDAREILEGEDQSLENILTDYFDDIAIDLVSNKARPNLQLIRFNIGVGGGNGMFLTYAATKKGFKLMSKTLDTDVVYCDRAVWLKN